MLIKETVPRPTSNEKRRVDFFASVSIPLHPAVKVLFGQITDCFFFNVWLDFICGAFRRPDKNVFTFVTSSAAVNRVPVLGLEGEPGLRRAQPHSAGEQEAGQGPGEPVTQ